jgi:hypothetical protein
MRIIFLKTSRINLEWSKERRKEKWWTRKVGMSYWQWMQCRFTSRIVPAKEYPSCFGWLLPWSWKCCLKLIYPRYLNIVSKEVPVVVEVAYPNANAHNPTNPAQSTETHIRVRTQNSATIHPSTGQDHIFEIPQMDSCRSECRVLKIECACPWI